MSRIAIGGCTAALTLLGACAPRWQPPSVVLQGASEQAHERVARALVEASSGAPGDVAGLGDLYLALGYSQAARECYAYAGSRSGAPEHYLLAAVAARQVNDSASARAHLERLLAGDSTHKASADNDSAHSREGRLLLADLELESGATASAEDLYRQVLKDDPDNPRAMLGLARTRLALEDGSEAVRWFQQVLAVRPSADGVRAGLAEAYRLAGRHELARLEQRRAGPGKLVSDDPAITRVGGLRLDLAAETVLALATRESTTAREVAGFAVAELGEVPNAARGIVQRATDIGAEEDSIRGRFWFAVAAVADHQGDSEGAVFAYQQALEATPNHAESWLRLGRALLQLGELDEAEQAFASSDSSDVDVVRDRALTLRRLERSSEAARILREAIAAADDPSAIDWLRLDLAESLSGQGDQQRALEIYRTVVDSRDSLAAASALARIATQQQEIQNDDAAAKSFRRAVAGAPEWLAPRYGLAATLGRLGRYDEAAVAYRQILDLQPSEEQAWLGAATADVLRGASAESVRSFLERGIAVLPQNRPLRATLARHLVVHGGTDSSLAARALELALGLVEEEASAADRETLAMALAASRRFEDAVRVQQELLTTASEADRPRLERNLELYRARQPCCR